MMLAGLFTRLGVISLMSFMPTCSRSVSIVALLVHHGGPDQFLPSFDRAAYVIAAFSLLGAGSVFLGRW